MAQHPPPLAFFVSPHGFGHAARASAVMLAVHERTRAEFEIFTTAPRWFFDESIGGLFRYHEVVTDVGFVQSSALAYDLAGTVTALDELLPYDEDLVARLAETVRAAGCSAVVCDIAPLGIAVAERSGLPSVLVENFTWPWLYEPLVERAPRLAEHSAELERWRGRAGVHIQTEPLCNPDPDALRVGPISRPPRRDRSTVRELLEIRPEERLVVVTMGGYGERMDFLDRLRQAPEVTFVVTGAEQTRSEANLRLFDNHTPLYMPDLLGAADGLVSKLGYGIIAEAWHAGLPFGWVSRKDFREMGPLEAFVRREMEGFQVESGEFISGDWVERVPELMELPRRPHEARAGARVADAIARAVSAG